MEGFGDGGWGMGIRGGGGEGEGEEWKGKEVIGVVPNGKFCPI